MYHVSLNYAHTFAEKHNVSGLLICAKFFAGDVAGSAKMQFEVLELVDALFCEVNPIPVKHALNLMGMEVGPLRMPLCPMEDANLERLKKAMKNYGILA